MDEMLVKKSELLDLDIEGRPCEVCNEHMHGHDWAVFDRHGFVVRCSNKEE